MPNFSEIAPSAPLKLLKMAGVALVQLGLTWFVLEYLSSPGSKVSLLYLPSGLVLAALLIGGRSYAAPLFIGQFAANILHGLPPFVGAGVSAGSTLAGLLGCALLTRKSGFNPSLNRVSDYVRLLVLGAIVPSAIDAANGVTWLWYAASSAAEDRPLAFMDWWLGNILGVVLVTPLILCGLSFGRRLPGGKALVEGGILFGIAAVAGQINILGWLKDSPNLELYHQIVDPEPHVYPLFLFSIWAAIRLGFGGVTILLSIFAVQGTLSALWKIGYFAADLGDARLKEVWLFLLAYAVNSAVLALFLSERKQTAENLRAIAENPRIGVAVVTDHKTAFVNATAATMIGEDASRIIGRPLGDFIGAEDAEVLLESCRKSSTGDPVVGSAEAWIRGKAGQKTAIDLSFAHAQWDGEPACAVFILDISERKRHEAALKESQKLAKLGSWTLNLSNSELAWSDEVFRIFEIDPSRFGASYEAFLNAVHPEDRRLIDKTYQDSVKNREPYSIVHRLLMSDGRIKWVEERGHTDYAADGHPLQSIGTVQDITERLRTDGELRRAQAELNAVQRQYVDLFEYATDGLVMTDREGRIKLVNRQTEALFGWTRAELIGQPVEILVPAEARGKHVGQRQEFLGGSVRRQMAAGSRSLRGVRKDGSEFPVEIDLAPINTGPDLMIAAAVRDVSAQRQLEEQLAQATKMDAIGKLTGGLAHDFNNYLGIIIGNLDLAKNLGNLEGRVSRLVESALAGALRAAELTQSLLAFARRQTLKPLVAQVNHSVTNVAALLKRTLGEDVAVVVDLAPDLWPVTVDPAQLESSIVNLANNARDAMKGGGTLKISTRNTALDQVPSIAKSPPAGGDFVLLEVADSGAGMTPDVLAQAFEPFFSTKGPGHGTGLGLSMVYGFVQQSGGHIRIESEVGRGTKVKIYLPRTRGSEALQSETALPRALVRGTETVLVVEDNEMVREGSRQQLEALGYKVMVAENGPAALQILRRRDLPIDLLFSDIVMAGQIDGRELAKQSLALRPVLKILLTSGFPDRETGRLEEVTAFPFLRKPFRLEQLAQSVREVLDGGPGLS